MRMRRSEMALYLAMINAAQNPLNSGWACADYKVHPTKEGAWAAMAKYTHMQRAVVKVGGAEEVVPVMYETPDETSKTRIRF